MNHNANAAVSVSYHAGAAADLSGAECLIVQRAASAGNKAVVEVADGLDAKCLGVATKVLYGAVGQTVTVCVFGLCQVLLGATFTPGTQSGFFKSDANGAAVPAAAGEAYVGRLLFNETSAALAAGDKAWALIMPTNGDGA